MVRFSDSAAFSKAKAVYMDLERHLQTRRLGAMYTSIHTQNEIIHACNDHVLNCVVCRAYKAGCFTILADESNDIATI